MRLQMKKYTYEQLQNMNLLAETNIKDQVTYNGMIDCFRKVYKNEGPLAFYKGLTPLLIKIFPSSGVFFCSYEASLRLLNQYDHHE
jgi:hypothetical protein